MNDNFNIDTLPMTEEIRVNFSKIIDLLGEDNEREGLEKTPMRAAKAMKFLNSIDADLSELERFASLLKKREN